MIPGRLRVKLEEKSSLTGPTPMLYTIDTVKSSYPPSLCTAKKIIALKENLHASLQYLFPYSKKKLTYKLIARQN